MSRFTIYFVLILSLFNLIDSSNKTEIKEPILKRPNHSKPVEENDFAASSERNHFASNSANVSSKFRPSTQVDEFYEYNNKFATGPFVAEAKNVPTVSHQQETPARTKNQNWKQEKPIRSESGPWVDLPTSHGGQKGWTNTFPSTQNPVFNIRSQVFPSYSGNQETTTIQYPYVVTGSGRHQPQGYDKGYGDNSILHKTNYEHSYPVTAHEEEMFPWKKIFKFLTAIIPIGLFLSALTPTVINVAPGNLTQMRSRAEDDSGISRDKLLSSLNYINKLESAECEEKIICELLLGAGSSQNAERHIKNLLNAFTRHERDSASQIEELNKIQQAVKSGNCSTIACNLSLVNNRRK